jgi:HTH-type transcriptional regulator / antitoxin HigA
MTTAAKRNVKRGKTKVNEILRRRAQRKREPERVGISSDAELAQVIKQIDKLLLKGAQRFVDKAILKALTNMVERYESRTIQMPAVSDVEMLRHLVEANDLTQIRLAEETGIAMSTISDILRGKRKMKLSHIRAFAKRFGVKPGAFLD